MYISYRTVTVLLKTKSEGDEIPFWLLSLTTIHIHAGSFHPTAHAYVMTPFHLVTDNTVW